MPKQSHFGNKAKQMQLGTSWPSKREIDMTVLESFGIICGPCSRDDNYSTASNYCYDCSENLCKSCVESHRIKQKTKHHKILSKTKGEAKAQNLPESYIRCQKHPKKVLEMYCVEHDCVVCADCIKSDHKDCPAIRHIPEIAKGVRRTTEHGQATDRMNGIRNQFLSLKREWTYDMKSLGKQKDDVIKTIADVRRKITFVLDTLEKNTRESLQVLYNTECRKIEGEIRECDTALGGLEKIAMKLGEAARIKNEAQIFVEVKNANMNMARFDDLYKTMVVRQKEPRIRFTTFDPVKAFPNLEAFGKVDLTYGGEGGTDYNVRISRDRKPCDISGSAFLADGRLVLTDRGNNRLKILDTHYNCTHHCDLPGQPQDVCAVGQNELAISFANLTKIQFVEVANGVTPTRSFETLETKCLGLACDGIDLYAVCWKERSSLRCYSLKGKLKMVTELTKEGTPMFIDPRRLVVSQKDTKLCVTDAKQGVMTFDTSGDFISTFTDPKLLSPVGITFTQGDGLYVCGFGSNTVIEIDEEGKKKSTILTAMDGLSKPKYLNFDRSRKRLIVMSAESDTIRVWQSF